MSITAKPPYKYFTEADGSALESGKIYVGVAGLDAEANPITAYWDSALTAAAAQPIRTIGGAPDNSGTPSDFFTAGDYSITVRDVNDVLVYSKLQLNANDVSFLYTNYDTVALLLASTEPSRGTGAIWEAGGFRYIEVASGGDITNSAGTPVELDVLQSDDGSFNVKAFGATGDGVTSDAPFINTAISAGGKRVVLPEGTYLLGVTASDYLDFSSLTDFEFIGTGGVLKLDGSTPVLSSKSCIEVTGCSDLLIRGVRFDGNAANNTSNTGAATGLVGSIATRTSQRVIVTECFIENSNNNGIYFTDGSTECIASNNVLRNNFGSDLRLGLASGGVNSSAVFTGNTLLLDTNIHAGVPKQDGMFAQRWGGDAVFSGNKIRVASTVTDTPASLIWLAQVNRCIVANNDVYSEVTASYGIQGNLLASAESIVVIGNNFRSSQGILFSDGSGTVVISELIVSNNRIDSIDSGGITITDNGALTLTSGIISDNVILYGGGNGIALNVGNAVASGNSIINDGTGSHGILVAGADSIANGNKIDMGASANRGLEVYGNNSVLSDNSIKNFTGVAIKEVSTADWNLIHGNHSRGTITVIGVNTVSANNV